MAWHMTRLPTARRVQLGVHVQTPLALKTEALAKGPETGWFTETMSSSPVRASRVTQGSCAKTSATVSCSRYGPRASVAVACTIFEFCSHWPMPQ